MKIVRLMVVLGFLLSLGGPFGIGPAFAQDVLDFRVIPNYGEGKIQVEGHLYKSRPRVGVGTRDRLAGLLLPWLEKGTLTVRFNSKKAEVPVEKDGSFQTSFKSSIFRGLVYFSIKEKVIYRGVFSFPQSVDYIVVSDVDDTVLDSNVKNKVKLVFSSFFKSADKRSPIVGTPDFYRKLTHGLGSWGKPLICYLTSSPAILSRYIKFFLKAKGFPMGLLLTKRSLKDGGGHGEHKLFWLERLTTIYPGKPFLLIGDSGERDPEIYLQFARKTKAPILGVIIHQRYDQAKRMKQLEATKSDFASLRIPFLLWKDPKALREAMKAAGAFPEEP